MKILSISLLVLLQSCSLQYTQSVLNSELKSVGLSATHSFHRTGAWRLADDTPIVFQPIAYTDHALPRFAGLVNRTIYEQLQTHFNDASQLENMSYLGADPASHSMTHGVLVSAEILSLNHARNSWSSMTDGPDLHKQTKVGRDSIRLKLLFIDMDTHRTLDQIVITSKSAFLDESSLYSGELLNDALSELFATII
jgi:hypothetical protein